MPITFQIKNLSQALKGIEKYSADVKQAVDDELTATSHEIVAMAQSLAPVDDGNLRANIRVARDEPLKKTIESAASYSAYQEFGTGGNVSVPQFGEGLEGIVEYAAQFKGAGLQGRHPVKFKDGSWRMVPYQVNIHAHPFFFPAIQSGTENLPKRLKAILEVGNYSLLKG